MRNIDDIKMDMNVIRLLLRRISYDEIEAVQQGLDKEQHVTKESMDLNAILLSKDRLVRDDEYVPEDNDETPIKNRKKTFTRRLKPL